MDSLLFVHLLLQCFETLGVWTLSKNRTKNWPGNGKKLNLCGAAIKKSNGIKYITRRSPQILNSGTYRKTFGDFSLAQMGDCTGIFNRPSDFSLAVGDWESGSLYPCGILAKSEAIFHFFRSFRVLESNIFMLAVICCLIYHCLSVSRKWINHSRFTLVI